ncbi:hypothetical protein [Methanoculleus chikugoensis]|uniref:hypothetical protein n=1 Tax=Methanoculleus chikugoensis TaxID=118126 RepID=UPI0006CF57E5|nr:hypothetical protein [Methanoculleus chikugoensis]
MIGGITEVIPAGYTYLGTTHPMDQTRTEESKVHFAILGEESITYTLSGPATPEINGTVLDLTNGISFSQPSAKQSPAPIAAVILGGHTVCCYSYLEGGTPMRTAQKILARSSLPHSS